MSPGVLGLPGPGETTMLSYLLFGWDRCVMRVGRSISLFLMTVGKTGRVGEGGGGSEWKGGRVVDMAVVGGMDTGRGFFVDTCKTYLRC